MFKQMIKFSVVSALVMVSVGAVANEAPVIDITQSSLPANPIAVPAPSNTETDPGGAGVSAANQDALANNQNQQVLPPPTNDMTDKQRIARLEQQIQNLTRQDTKQVIGDLQQQVQQLNGQVQVLQHDLKLLNNQQRTFYKDLSQRISQLQTGKPNQAMLPANTTKEKVASNATTTESSVYKKAFSLLVKKQYGKARSAFEGYLSDYPRGVFVASAHYWLGEIYLLQKKLANAEIQFTTVVEKFSKSSKAPDAKLKVAVIHLQQKKVTQAKREFLKIKQQYPDSTAAQLASIQLQQLKLDNHK